LDLSFLFVRLFFLTGIFLILVSANRLKGIWFWDLFAIIVLSVLFGFATSVPELGGTVGYELNLFLQDYIGKTGTL
jgi:S-DNA-T family DNA segregation ATPase FtsK/SpoIIIE